MEYTGELPGKRKDDDKKQVQQPTVESGAEDKSSGAFTPGFNMSQIAVSNPNLLDLPGELQAKVLSDVDLKDQTHFLQLLKSPEQFEKVTRHFSADQLDNLLAENLQRIERLGKVRDSNEDKKSRLRKAISLRKKVVKPLAISPLKGYAEKKLITPKQEKLRGEKDTSRTIEGVQSALEERLLKLENMFRKKQ